jgi:hypothetical protein
MSKENSSIPVWRYMSFAKFVWSIQNKSLWLSRADLLGDPWEISLSGEQLQLVIDRHPITPIDEAPRETAKERAKRIIDLWRNNTFINCCPKIGVRSHIAHKNRCQVSYKNRCQVSYKNRCQVSHCTYHDKVLDCRDPPIKWYDYVATIENRVRWCSVSHYCEGQ